MSEAENMRRLHQTMAEIDNVCADLACGNRPYLGNALLNLALGYLVEQHGQRGTAGLLTRVIDELAAGALPSSSECALDAVRLDS